MSAPHESEDDDQRLSRYLLGLLPDEEAERLDEASIADDGVAARLRAVEHDLVDAYVRRRLPEPTRRQFEAVYLASPRRRQKVTMAEALLARLDRPAGAVAERSAGAVAERPAAAVPEPPSAAAVASAPVAPVAASWPGLAMAAMLTLVVGGGLILTVGSGGREPGPVRDDIGAVNRGAPALAVPADPAPADPAPAVPATAAPAPVMGAEGRGRDVLAQIPGGAARDAAPGPAGPASPQAARLVFVLSPPIRGAGALPEIAVPPGATTVTLDLQLDADDFARYEATLKDADAGTVIWRSRRLAARSAAVHPTAAVAVPAAVLRPQVYSLELSGHGPGEAAQLVGVYAFRIVRP